MHVTVSTPGLLAFRRDLKAISAAGMGKDLGKRLREAAKPLRPAIQAQAAARLPKRGGYAAVMSKSVRARTSVKENRLSALISVTIYSAGKKQRRDIVKVDDGVLRHPVFGRSRRLRRGVRAGTYIRNPWAATSVPPRFVSDPIDDVGPRVSKAGRDVVDDFINRLKG
jgi:hypothetical protein